MLGDTWPTVIGGLDVYVSILVLLDHAGRQEQPKDAVADSRRVSILVLLDHAGRPQLATLDASLTTGFDPCSPGSCWATSPMICFMPSRGRFDPCSPGSCWATNYTFGKTIPEAMFRSLFSWIMLGDFPDSLFANHAIGGFDPCSPGSCWATWPRPRLPSPGQLVSILVLLDHAGRLPGRTHG